MTWSPSFTASAPPGRKSYCTSTTMKTSSFAGLIDGAVHVTSRRPLRQGDIVTVKIERADAYDLHGAAV